MRYLRLLVFYVCTYLSCAQIIAQGPNGSGTYYQNADGMKGAALKTALCGIIYDRNEGGDLSTAYKALWTHFRTTDAKPNGKVWDMYSNKVEFEFGTNQDTGSGSQEGQYYNREHSMPNSWFGGKVMPMYTDLHHMYPTDKVVNNKRSNFPFGETANPSWKSANDFSKLGPCSVEGYTGTVFEPNDEYKGDFARTYFYMVTCYEEQIPTWYTSFSESQPTLDGNKYPGLSEWQLKMLMKWAKNDPVSEKEINRNNAVYSIQNNRNPFIDYPGLEEYIWGDKIDEAFSYNGEIKQEDTTPNVKITSPASGGKYISFAPAGATDFPDITITATADDPNGTVEKVEFYDGTTLLATCTAQPYQATLSGAKAGMHTLKAIATDNDGETSTASVTVTLQAPTSLTISSDFKEGGELPAGWTTYDSSERRIGYNSGYSSGCRVLQFTGTSKGFDYGLYFRNINGNAHEGWAKYGLSDAATTLRLASGHYTLKYKICNWNMPNFGQVEVCVEKRTGASIVSQVYMPNINIGNKIDNNFSSPAQQTFEFDVTEKGDYVIAIYSAASGWSDCVVGQLILANSNYSATAITHTLSITASGNGYVAYDGNTIRSKTSSFDVVEGANAVLKFSSDDGNRLKSVKVNGQDVTSAVVGNQFTISNITASTSVDVLFEPIPSYTLNIIATGNGSASYNGATIRNQSQSFTLREGASAMISFSVDNGCRIKTVKVNNTDMSSQINNGQITINSITKDTNVEVIFEELPHTTYSLSITASGNGSITYNSNIIKGKTSSFTVVEGSYVTVRLSADDGYRLKTITLNGQDVTADVANNQYTTPKMMADAALVVVFEAIPTFALTVKSSAFGSVKFGDAIIANRTETFSVREGTSATMTFTPDDNGRLHSITLNGTDITKELVNGQYTISNIRADQSVEAEFVEDITKVTDAGIAYTVTSYDEQTVVVAAGNYGNVLTVPASFTAKEKTWIVVGIDEDALKDNTTLAAIVWNPEVAFTAKVSNPNLLLYVKDAQYAPATIQNVVVNNQAENIVLVEAASGNDFYCPQAFTAKRISYEHNYSMISGYKTCQGWETLVLPFDVTMMINAKGQELTPYINWQYGNSQRPFWLYEMTTQGWKAGSAIKANTPYIISMPNNEMYDVSFNQTGNIQFIGTNVEVKASTEMKTGQHGNKRLVANYQTQAASSDIYALNVSNDWHQNTATEKEGCTFIRSLRSVHPFEAYLTVEGSNAPWAIPVFENGVLTDMSLTPTPSPNGEGSDDWYTIDGRKLQGEPKKNGIYLHNGKKVRK